MLLLKCFWILHAACGKWHLPRNSCSLCSLCHFGGCWRHNWVRCGAVTMSRSPDRRHYKQPETHAHTDTHTDTDDTGKVFMALQVWMNLPLAAVRCCYRSLSSSFLSGFRLCCPVAYHKLGARTTIKIQCNLFVCPKFGKKNLKRRVCSRAYTDHKWCCADLHWMEVKVNKELIAFLLKRLGLVGLSIIGLMNILCIVGIN